MIAVILTLNVGACSFGSQHNQSAESGLNLKADINKANIAVTLPSDRYIHIQMLSSEEITLQSADSAVFVESVRNELHIPMIAVPTWRLGDGKPYTFTEFGPWNVKIAEKYGFSNPSLFNEAIPETRIKIPAGEIDPLDYNSQFSEQQQQIAKDQCANGDSLNRFNTRKLAPFGPWIKELNNTRNKLLKDERAQKVISELDQCFTRKGLKMNSEIPGYVEGVDTFDITPENTAIAVKVAQCQGELNTP
ncbi:hypothetical protein [Arcanobacterium ihumii]|uniref:hypothetical protein n=1 Tax=Arcanobacterium ihumii TaxID=2138162 RepID=UPI000F53C16A|nr:hypothetical protein [Arcanobacterium ihumii]